MRRLGQLSYTHEYATGEFGRKLRAWAVTAGGVSGDPASTHFNDQGRRYASGNLRPGHIERTTAQASTEAWARWVLSAGRPAGARGCRWCGRCCRSSR
ncbi:penicillin acylase family protein [Kribbella sp. NPDC023855]|uniref:penicillin acylase family protein n=1 Tax=Kribbella sp. NPDC023855 TaxID=3154698 RepID=UPI0033C14675